MFDDNKSEFTNNYNVYVINLVKTKLYFLCLKL